MALRVVETARTFLGKGPDIWVSIFDFDGTVLAFARG